MAFSLLGHTGDLLTLTHERSFLLCTRQVNCTENKILTPKPRLLRLGLLDLPLHADTSHEARLTGQPRGPITGLHKVDRELSGASALGPHCIHSIADKTAVDLQIAVSAQSPTLFVTLKCHPRNFCTATPPAYLRRFGLFKAF